MSSISAVENAIDVMPLAIVKQKTPIMETNMPVIEELEIDMGDYEYRHRNNFMKSHKFKMLDVLIEMKRLFPFDTRHSGKIYEQTGHLRFHPLFPYFRRKETYNNQGKWNTPPTWFREKLEKSIKEHPDLKNDKILIEKCMKYIKIWYDNEGHITENGHRNWEWNEDRTERLPIWNLKTLYSELNNYQKWKGEWIVCPYQKTQNNSEDYERTKKIKKELYKKPDAEGYYNEAQMRNRADEDNAPLSIRNELKEWENKIEYHKTDTSIYGELRDAFTYRRNIHFLKKEGDEYKDILTMKIKRLFQGDRMDYKANFVGLYSMLRWKKTMANGNCSNKSLKATHLYYRDPKEQVERYGHYDRGGWIFEAVKIGDAIACAEKNGFPKWGKKGNGKKAPTYREIKMWWYKLE